MTEPMTNTEASDKDKAKERKTINLLKIKFLIAAVILLIFLIFILLPHFDKHSYKSTGTLPKQSLKEQPKLASTIAQANTNALLTDLQTKLAMIEQTLANQDSKDEMNKQYRALHTYEQTLLSDEDNNRQTIISSVSKDNQTIMTQLNQLEVHLNNLMNILQKNHISYLQASILPFKVLAIDMIQQQPVVTIYYSHDTFPISIDEAVAGWQLNSANYTKQEIIFKNTQDQYVKINLNSNK